MQRQKPSPPPLPYATSTVEEVTAFFRRVEPSGSSTTSLKALHRALRPGQSMKHLLKKPEEAAKDFDVPITSADMVTDGLTEEEAAAMEMSAETTTVAEQLAAAAATAEAPAAEEASKKAENEEEEEDAVMV